MRQPDATHNLAGPFLFYMGNHGHRQSVDFQLWFITGSIYNVNTRVQASKSVIYLLYFAYNHTKYGQTIQHPTLLCLGLAAIYSQPMYTASQSGSYIKLFK